MVATDETLAEVRETLPVREPSTAAAVLENADIVAPAVLAEADRCESQTRLSSALTELFRRAGLFQMGFPASRGGIEMRLADQLTVVTKIAKLDASAGWNVAVLNASGFYAGRLDEDAYRSLYPTRDLPTGGSFHPPGRAEIVDGGYLVSGRWDWGSGTHTAEHVVGGCQVYRDGEPVCREDGRQLLLGVWLPRDSVSHIPNWNALGIRGSGSSSYEVIEPVFVPANHTFDRGAPPNPLADPLNKHVELLFFPLTGVYLGLAQRIVDFTLDAVHSRSRGDISRVDGATSQQLGQACCEVEFARSGVTDVARRTDDAIFAPHRVLTPLEEARLRVANSQAAQTLRRVLDLCSDLYGSRYIYQSDPLERVIRDSWGALAHFGAKRFHWSGYAATLLTQRSEALSVHGVPA
ncbi:acyl-CoA dehydrogenase family protein [Sciscionella marina]|uniref:acyl-CoA dehydrogenase family protein n=1 Tax=Sciscionella marina TaxID=508770 RepID=UPI00036281F5|nr:acyl-CoA dehydrogenase family protein [Sciscionella marina]